LTFSKREVCLCITGTYWGLMVFSYSKGKLRKIDQTTILRTV
jgi:hypothetical protein